MWLERTAYGLVEFLFFCEVIFWFSEHGGRLVATSKPVVLLRNLRTALDGLHPLPVCASELSVVLLIMSAGLSNMTIWAFVLSMPLLWHSRALEANNLRQQAPPGVL